MSMVTQVGVESRQLTRASRVQAYRNDFATNAITWYETLKLSNLVVHFALAQAADLSSVILPPFFLRERSCIV